MCNALQVDAISDRQKQVEVTDIVADIVSFDSFYSVVPFLLFRRHLQKLAAGLPILCCGSPLFRLDLPAVDMMTRERKQANRNSSRDLYNRHYWAIGHHPFLIESKHEYTTAEQLGLEHVSHAQFYNNIFQVKGDRYLELSDLHHPSCKRQGHCNGKYGH